MYSVILIAMLLIMLWYLGGLLYVIGAEEYFYKKYHKKMPEAQSLSLLVKWPFLMLRALFTDKPIEHLKG